LRSKAWKHKFFDVSVEHRLDHTVSPPVEMVEIILRRGRPEKSPRIRLTLWEDRWAEVDAREAGRTGWRWSCRFQGRVLGGREGKQIIQDIEAFDALLDDDRRRADPEVLSSFWDGKLARGPTRLVR